MIKVNNQVVDFKRFNDGTLRLDFPTGPAAEGGTATITWLYDSDLEISELYYLVRHLQSMYHLSLNLNMPYVNSARMDRYKEKSECFTLKYFCEFINNLNFNKITIFDPHSRVSQALLNNVEVEMPTDLILSLLKRLPDATLCFPDTGAQEKYSRLFNDIYFAFGVKDREWSSQKIKSLQIMGAKHQISGHNILLCDDILSRGSTTYLASKQLKELGANKIYIFVSHCENTVLGPHINGQSLLDIPDLIEKIYTTNSIYRGDHSKIEVIKEF